MEQKQKGGCAQILNSEHGDNLLAISEVNESFFFCFTQVSYTRFLQTVFAADRSKSMIKGVRWFNSGFFGTKD